MVIADNIIIISVMSGDDGVPGGRVLIGLGTASPSASPIPSA